MHRGYHKERQPNKKNHLFRGLENPDFSFVLTTLRSKTPSFASCNKLTNLVVNKPSDFSCRLGVPGEPKSAMLAELHAAKRPCVAVIG